MKTALENKAIEYSEAVVKEIAAEIKKECFPMSVISDEKFIGISWAQICRILEKYGFIDTMPF